MLIEFECTNIIDFDAAAGRYTTCGKRLVVSDDKVGEMVRCRKCNQLIEVPFDATQSAAPAPAKKTQARDKSQPAVAATKSKSKVNGQRAKKSNRRRPVNDVLPPPTDMMTIEFEAESVVSHPSMNSYENRCPKCGAPINAQGKCTDCRYVEQQFESSYLPVDEIEMQLAGFQKWFCDILTEGVSMKWLSIVFHLLVGATSAVLTLLGVLVSGAVGWGLVVSVGIFCSFYIAFVIKGYDLRNNPRAKLAWFQKPVWYAILLWFRLTRWRNFECRNAQRKTIDKRNAPVVDENFHEIAGLKHCQVLDLEGTLVTDRVLRPLYGHRYLQCLVLRKTKVSQEGVMRLQQANPNLWIWY